MAGNIFDNFCGEESEIVMKMPEGWNRLKEDQVAFSLSTKHYELNVGVTEALELIKEMAEALDWYTKPNNWPMARQVFGNEVTYHEFDINCSTSKTHEVLKKFKEWK